MTLPTVASDAEAFERLSKKLGKQQSQLRDELAELQKGDNKSRFTKKVVNGQANALTLASAINANEDGREYRVSFAAGPSVWAGASQATAKGDGLLVQVLRQDGTVLAWHVHRPEPWSGKPSSQKLKEASFVYKGDGTGDVTLHITASDYTGRFGGAIDDVTIKESGNSQVLFTENFNNSQLGSVKGKQAGTGLPVYAKCSILAWQGDGTNHSHLVQLKEDDQANLALQIYSGPAGASTNPR
ncbi:MAG: hypothetical protein GY888_10885, partial [Planctomycetaceae bacterium]|nr:hypothetical protein [Planctomycetaceae bacterium]